MGEKHIPDIGKKVKILTASIGIAGLAFLLALLVLADTERTLTVLAAFALIKYLITDWKEN